MVITRISSADLLKSTATSLGLHSGQGTLEDDALLAALLRRAAGTHSPCSPATLISAVMDSLQSLAQGDSFKERLEDIIEHLVIMGDFLELSQVTLDNSNVKGTWIFMAPPSFVRRPHGGVILTGISPDEATPLPASLATRVCYEGVARTLSAESAEDIAAILKDLGLVELSPERWLRPPVATHPEVLRDDMVNRLAAQPASGTIPDLTIIDPAQPVTHYRRRWIPATDRTGRFVARRPQAYGAPLWGFVELESGNPRRFLDFPLHDFPFRGCDIAWYLQMALDAARGTPQRYRIRRVKDGTCLDFFSPLPLWAGRRLRILGRTHPTDACLASYLISEKELEAEVHFLRDNLWLRQMTQLIEDYA